MNVAIYPMLIKVTILINKKNEITCLVNKITHEIIELLSSKSQIIILIFEACLSPNQTKIPLNNEWRVRACRVW